MIRYLCAECQGELRPPERSADGRVHESHGLCRSCMAKVMSRLGQSLKDYLNELPEPVLVMNQYALVLTVNEAGQRVLGKSLPEVEGYLAGEVLGCLHAKEPEGCGATIHCLSCVIRNNIEDTYRTGKAHLQVPACHDLDTFEGPRTIRFFLSTEKVDDLVVLQLEKLTSG